LWLLVVLVMVGGCLFLHALVGPKATAAPAGVDGARTQHQAQHHNFCFKEERNKLISEYILNLQYA
jgi:hypothetical protein